jgi:dienelactone hydrolase
MKWYHYLMFFLGGAFVANFVPHFVNGIAGMEFPTPFANPPPPEGVSSPPLNVAWALGNLAVGYLLLRYAKFSLRDWPTLIPAFLGNAARLFPEVGDRAVVALDYPYTGPEKVRGLLQIARTVPLARQAFRDTPPAIMLTMDWLQQQDWVDSGQIIIVGASLGVPFAALAAARDPRIDGAFLVHGAADNELWLEAQVARRTEAEFLHKPFAVLLHWLAYGPTFDTRRNIAAIAPRPVLIIGARHDERTPAGQTELLFAAAEQPKWLRWTEGTHIQPDRMQVIDELLRIADEMLPFPQGPAEDP